MLGVHAVVGGKAEDGAELQELACFSVDACVKLHRLGRVGCEPVLDVVGGRQIKEVGHSVFQKRNACPQDIKTGVGAVDGRNGMADEFFDMGNAVTVFLRLIRFF